VAERLAARARGAHRLPERARGGGHEPRRVVAVDGDVDELGERPDRGRAPVCADLSRGAVEAMVCRRLRSMVTTMRGQPCRAAGRVA
jgi:hypothetical protein